MFLKKCGPGQAGLLPVGHARGQLSLDHAHGGRSPLKAVNPCMISIQRRCVDSSGAQIEDETIRTPQTRRLVMIGELLADDEFLSLFQSHCDDVLSRPSIQNSLSPVMVKEEAIGPDLKLDSPEPIPTVVPAVPGDRSPSPPQYYLPIVDEIVEEVIEPASSAPTLPPSFDDGFTRVSRRKPKRSSRPQRIVREHQTVLAEHVVPPSAPPLLPPTQPAHPRTTSLADKVLVIMCTRLAAAC